MKTAAPLLALALTALTQSGFAADEGTAAVNELGQLNGIALACKQPALVSRARNSIVTTAPKTRDIGEMFENATNSAYLEQGKGKTPCPDGAALAGKIGAAEKRLQAAYPRAQ
jgi:hypothetical protein